MSWYDGGQLEGARRLLPRLDRETTIATAQRRRQYVYLSAGSVASCFVKSFMGTLLKIGWRGGAQSLVDSAGSHGTRRWRPK